jgi:hypothetical protein
MSAQHDTPTLSPPQVSETRPEPELQAPAPGRAHLNTRISGIRAGLIAGALVMAAAGTARIAQLRQVMRRDRRKARAA